MGLAGQVQICYSTLSAESALLYPPLALLTGPNCIGTVGLVSKEIL